MQGMEHVVPHMECLVICVDMVRQRYWKVLRGKRCELEGVVGERHAQVWKTKLASLLR
jgi:hypothetical protein